MKINIFIDMDGVLAQQDKDLTKYMHNKDFFLNLPPENKMILVTKALLNNANYNIYILSSVIESPYCQLEKNLWLDNHLSEMPKYKRLFVPYGVVKSKFAQKHVDTKDAINVLIDDFTVNLDAWKLDGALGIKVINQINNTKGTWINKGGLFLNAYDNVEENVDKINNIIRDKVIEVNLSKSTKYSCMRGEYCEY